jgi:hypothetical protein
MLLWVSCCGVYLMLLRRTGSTSPTWDVSVIFVLHALGHGAALAGCLMFIGRWLRGRRWVMEPGFWLLATLGAVAVARIILGLIPRDVFHQDEAVLAALACCLLVVPALERETPPVWKGAFCLLAVVLAVPLLTAVGQMAFAAGGGGWTVVDQYVGYGRLPACVLILAVPVAVDIRQKIRHTWMHWVGLVVLVWILALPAAELQF